MIRDLIQVYIFNHVLLSVFNSKTGLWDELSPSDF